MLRMMTGGRFQRKHPASDRDGSCPATISARMHDTQDEIGLWQALLTQAMAPLRDAAAAADPADVRAIAALRRQYPADLVTVALRFAVGRRKAAVKFPGEAMVADGAGVEQATSRRVADYKAARFRAAAPSRIVDVCSGIGADTMSLRHAGEVVAVDGLPLRAWMTGENAGCAVVVGDVERTLPDGDLFHCDPDRRDRHVGAGSAQRLVRLQDYRPGAEFLFRLIEERGHGAIKLGPGIDIASLPQADDLELEFVSEHGRLVTALLWCGRLASTPRRATLLPGGVTVSGDPVALPGWYGEIGRFLFEPDAALERAGLLGQIARGHALGELHPGLGLLTGEADADTPWLRRFAVIDSLPWREDALADRLRAHDAGEVEVKTRGAAIDAMAVQRGLATSGLRGSRRLVLFGLRLGKRRIAIIAERHIDQSV